MCMCRATCYREIRKGLCVSLYLVLPNLRPLKPSLSAPLLDSKYQKAADSIETTQIQMLGGIYTTTIGQTVFLTAIIA